MQQQEQIKAGEEIRQKNKNRIFENLISIVASLIAQLILHSNCNLSFGW